MGGPNFNKRFLHKLFLSDINSHFLEIIIYVGVDKVTITL